MSSSGYGSFTWGEDMAVYLSLDDNNLEENEKAVMTLKKSGLFSDEEIQRKYDEQVLKDRKGSETE